MTAGCQGLSLVLGLELVPAFQLVLKRGKVVMETPNCRSFMVQGVLG